MISITTPRQHAEFGEQFIFVYINLLKETNIVNVQHLKKSAPEYLMVRLVNSLLSDIEILFRRKLLMTQGKNINIKMSHAHGIAFYKVLLTLPVPADNFYFNHIRNAWVEILDQQILK